MTRTTTAFPIGSWERPDAGRIVCRGEGVSEFFTYYVGEHGESPPCFAGHEFGCERESVMEVYGFFFCEAHGEEAASAALEEIAFDLEQYLDLERSTHRGGLSPHIEHTLRVDRGTTPDADGGVDDAALLRAFPLDEESRKQVEAETFMYIEDWKAGKREFGMAPPYDTHLFDRTLVCRHMRLAFEDNAT